MKRIILLIVLSSMDLFAFAQNIHPVSWKFSSEKIDQLTYKIKLEATVKEPYHIYSQEFLNSGFGMPTEFLFVEDPNVTFIGRMEEKGVEQKGEERLAYYSKGVTFTQTLKLKAEKKTTLAFTIKYMACTNEMCLLPSSKQFTLALNDQDKDDVGTNAQSTANKEVKKKVSLVLGGLPVGTKAPELKVDEWLSEIPDMKGKFVALDFWGTHCKPCIAGFAHINELHRRYKDKIVFIATTEQAKPGTPEEVYVFEGGAPIEFYSMLKKSFEAYNVQGIPYMIVVDPKGIIRFSGNGHDLDDDMLLGLFAKYGNE